MVLGRFGYALGGVVFATDMGGYQKPSPIRLMLSGIITFAFPHIGVTKLNRTVPILAPRGAGVFCGHR